MKSKREIQTEAKQYWQSIIEELNKLFEDAFAQVIREWVRKDADIPKYVVLPRGIEMEFEGHTILPMPDFKDTKPKLGIEMFKSALESLENIPPQARLRIFIDIFGKRPIQYEKFFCDGGFYNYLWTTRNEIVKQRKSVRKKLSGVKSKIYSTLRTPLIPLAGTMLRNAHENLFYSLTFYDLLVNHIDKWFKYYGVEADTEKDHRKHKCWQKIINKSVDSIEKEGVIHTHACRMTAALLAAVYPKIWGNNPIDQNAQIIRQRIYRMKYH